MCIAILNKRGVLDKDALKNCWEANNDGAGYLHPDEKGGLAVHKELKSFNKFYEAYIKAREKHPDVKFLVHFRIGTQGLKNLDNCHPFMANPKLGWIHNGMISCMPHDMKLSDTNIMNHTLSMLRVGSEATPEFAILMKALAGNSNKFVFLNSKNNHLIINESMGHWDEAEDNWFSNYSYKKSQPVKYPMAYTYGGQAYSYPAKKQTYADRDACDLCFYKKPLNRIDNLCVCDSCLL